MRVWTRSTPHRNFLKCHPAQPYDIRTAHRDVRIGPRSWTGRLLLLTRNTHTHLRHANSSTHTNSLTHSLTPALNFPSLSTTQTPSHPTQDRYPPRRLAQRFNVDEQLAKVLLRYANVWTFVSTSGRLRTPSGLEDGVAVWHQANPTHTASSAVSSD
jgi:hypothetical protein